MNMRGCVIILTLFATLGGCAHRGCPGYACYRPDSNDQTLVIWWPSDMRQGIDELDHEQDFTIVPLRD